MGRQWGDARCVRCKVVRRDEKKTKMWADERDDLSHVKDEVKR